MSYDLWREEKLAEIKQNPNLYQRWGNPRHLISDTELAKRISQNNLLSNNQPHITSKRVAVKIGGVTKLLMGERK